MIAAYVEDHVASGLRLFHLAATTLNDARSAHELGMLLRTRRPDESSEWLAKAAAAGHDPESPVPQSIQRMYYKNKNYHEDEWYLRKRRCWNPNCRRPTKYTKTNTNDVLQSISEIQAQVESEGHPTEDQRVFMAALSETELRSIEKDTAWRRMVEDLREAVGGLDLDQPLDKPVAAPILSFRVDGLPTFNDVYRVPRLSKCVGCYRASYCGRACQRVDWKREGGHKTACYRLDQQP